MGCDIHLQVERQDMPFARWQRAEGMERNPYVEEDGEPERRECWYHDRNYALFAVLAGVRNYWGIDPIAEPRGIPTACAPETMVEYERGKPDWHTPSYLTLEELLRFDWWTPRIPRKSVVADRTDIPGHFNQHGGQIERARIQLRLWGEIKHRDLYWEDLRGCADLFDKGGSGRLLLPDGKILTGGQIVENDETGRLTPFFTGSSHAPVS